MSDFRARGRREIQTERCVDRGDEGTRCSTEDRQADGHATRDSSQITGGAAQDKVYVMVWASEFKSLAICGMDGMNVPDANTDRHGQESVDRLPGKVVIRTGQDRTP